MEFKLRLDCFGLMEKVESTTIYLQYCRINRSFGLCTADLKQSSSNSFLLDLALGFLVVAASVFEHLSTGVLSTFLSDHNCGICRHMPLGLSTGAECLSTDCNRFAIDRLQVALACGICRKATLICRQVSEHLSTGVLSTFLSDHNCGICRHMPLGLSTGHQKSTSATLVLSLLFSVSFLTSTSLYLKQQDLMAPPAKKLASRRRPRSPHAGQGSRASRERRTKHREDRLPELLIPPNLQFKGWSPFCYSYKQYSSSAVTEFYHNLRESTTGVDIFAHHPTPEEYYALITSKPYDPTDRKQLNANSFPPLHRLIHHIFTTLIVPKDGSRELVTSLTSLFLFLGIIIPEGEMTVLPARSSYDLTAAQRMGYKFMDGVVTRDLKGKSQAVPVDDEEADEAADEEVDENEVEEEDSQYGPLDAPGDDAHDVAVEPSIRELLAQLQLQMSTGFERLNHRMDRLDALLDSIAPLRPPPTPPADEDA
ncbi:hypothetical protein Taro_021490 [Colocasia esculenta]|uniref:Uncharacterized protein n=1 Tax=Colocasia esculenta TaxID=4460 RepID=A0A843UYZ7_COLES|nr:hypothetical protein [Colocasia esculenta]